MTDSINPKAYPLASQELEQQLYNLCQQATRIGQIRKGANEATKALNKGRAEIIILAADAEPIEIILHLPLLCEDKNVPYVFVKSKMALGRSTSIARPVIAVAIIGVNGSTIEDEIQNAKLTIDRLPI